MMDEQTFIARRRQMFLGKAWYDEFTTAWARHRLWLANNPSASGRDKQEGWLLSKFGIADDSWNELLLNYTAGHPIPTLRDQLETVIQAIETYTAALRDWHNNLVSPPSCWATSTTTSS